MTKEDFKKQVEELVAKKMPRKRRKDICTNLLFRLWKKGAVRREKALPVREFARDIPTANIHLGDMQKAGLVERKSNEPMKFFLDSREAYPKCYVRNPVRIRQICEENAEALFTHAKKDIPVRNIVLKITERKSLEEAKKLFEKEDKFFNEIVEALKNASLFDKKNGYNIMGWRTGAHFWYVDL